MIMGSEKVVVTVSVTGSIGDRTGNPSLPVTPREIAESALEAHDAGATVVHIHVRDVDSGKPSMEFSLYEEVVRRIRDRSEMIINLTTGAGARFIPDHNDPTGPASGSTLCPPQRRIEHVLRLVPEICSLDVGSMNFDMGHIEIANHLIETKRVKRPPLFQLCMGTRWGIPATAQNMALMKHALPTDAIWAGFGIGATSFQMLAQSVLLGGNVRIGFEDTLRISKGQLATSNRQLVEKAVEIIRLLGKEPATIRESREILHLNP
jgi:uncharacterized protein (DUF849 family)